MCGLLGCSQPTLRKAINQLKDASLMDEERQGLNRPNLIYLYYVEQNSTGDFVSARSERIFQSGVKDSFSHECKDLSPNDTDIKDTKNNNTDNLSISPQQKITSKFHSEKNGLIDKDKIDDVEYFKYKELIKSNIDYDSLLRFDFENEEDLLNEYVDLITDAVCSTSDTLRVNNEDKPQVIVKSQLLKLNRDHIEYVRNSIKYNTSKVNNIRSYLLTALYNAPSTFHNKIWSDIAYDMSHFDPNNIDDDDDDDDDGDG
jgi:hypothetical protein